MKNQTEIDFEQLEAQYGADLANEIRISLDFATERNTEWKFEIIEETTNFITFAFVRSFSTRVYWVSKIRKVIEDKYTVNSYVCEKINKLMNDMD